MAPEEFAAFLAKQALKLGAELKVDPADVCTATVLAGVILTLVYAQPSVSLASIQRAIADLVESAVSTLGPAVGPPKGVH